MFSHETMESCKVLKPIFGLEGVEVTVNILILEQIGAIEQIQVKLI